MSQNRNFKVLTLLACFCLLFGVFAQESFSKASKKKASNNSAAKQITEEDKQLAQCIKDKGITMYGTSWCPHCKHQKSEFGAKNDEEFAQIANYVDCEASAKECRDKKVTGYPTWLQPDGKELQQGTIKEIAKDCGCEAGQAQLKPAKNEVQQEQNSQVQTIEQEVQGQNTQSNDE